MVEHSERKIYTYFFALPKQLYSYSTLRPMHQAITHLNLDLERMLVRATEDYQLLMFSLSSNQVYIGFVTGAVDPADDDDMLRILPLISGYRHADTKKFEPVNFYDEMYEKVDNGSETTVTIDTFEVAIRKSEISSVRQFDVNLYDSLNSTKPNFQQKNHSSGVKNG